MKFTYTVNLIVLSATQIPRVSPSFCSSRIYQKFNVLWIYKETFPWFTESIIVCIYYSKIKKTHWYNEYFSFQGNLLRHKHAIITVRSKISVLRENLNCRIWHYKRTFMGFSPNMKLDYYSKWAERLSIFSSKSKVNWISSIWLSSSVYAV